MRLIFLTSFLVLTSILTFNCKQKPLLTLEYSKLVFDSNKIVIFEWNKSNYCFPKNSDPLLISQRDIEIADSFLAGAIDTFNKKRSPHLYATFDKHVPIDSFTIKKDRYKYQYFPYNDVNGQRIIYIRGFNFDFKGWRDEPCDPGDDYGMHMLEITINLSDHSRSDISIGGFG